MTFSLAFQYPQASLYINPILQSNIDILLVQKQEYRSRYGYPFCCATLILHRNYS